MWCLLHTTIAISLLACGHPIEPRRAPTLSHDGSGSAKHSTTPVVNSLTYSCKIKPPDQIVVFDIGPMNQGTVDVSDLITERLRNEILDRGLNLSVYRRYAVYEQWDQGCKAEPGDDGSCMAAIGKRLRTDWVLWGEVARGSKGYEVQLQLVSVGDSTHRELTFGFPNRDGLTAAVAIAWRTLVKP